MTRTTTARTPRPGAPAALSFSLALAFGLGLTAAGRADAATLRWKFKAGEELHYQMVQKTVTAMKANGQDLKTTQDQTIDMTWKIGKVAEDGTAEIAQSIDRIRTKIDSAFGAFAYDSDDPKPAEGPIAAGVIPTLKALVGATFRYKMSPRGELTDVKVPEGLIQQLKESSPAAGAVGMFSEEGLKNMIHESSLDLPVDDLAKGKAWSRQTKLPPSPVGLMSFDKTYTYEGPADGGEKIALSSKIALEPTPGSNLDVKLGAQEGKGDFVFDNAAGRVSNSSVTQRIEMVITVMNQQITNSTETSSSMKLVEGKSGGGAKKAADEVKK